MSNIGLIQIKSAGALPVINTMTDYSLSETASRARLAAKGAGYHWGQADEVYRSIFWLIERKLPALSLLKPLLESYTSPDDVAGCMPSPTATGFRSQGTFICPIQLGCALSDSMDSSNLSADITFDNVKYPFLLLPFVSELAVKFDRLVIADFNKEQCITDGTHLRVSSDKVPTLENATSGKLTLANAASIAFDRSEVMQLHSRVQVESTLWESLDELAQRTYAPASEASRLLGAGAGVQDND